MAPRTTTPKPEDTGPLEPKTEKSKVEKAKATSKIKAKKMEKAARVKIEKAEQSKEEMQSTREEKSKDGKREKIKAVTGDEAVAVVLEYLKSQNRPFSATEVSANLHGKVTKSMADKLLKEMEQNQQIMAKATNGDKKGSQWVFWTLQDPADAASAEELATMDNAITALRASIPGLKNSLKATTANLNRLKSAPTASELGIMVENLHTENKIKTDKVTGLRQGTIRQTSKEEMEKIEKEWRYWGSKRKVRKNAFDALERELIEGMTKEELWEKAGLESED